MEGLHHLHDLHHQGVFSVAGVFLDISSANATNITVQGVTVWAAQGQDLLFPELGKVDQAPHQSRGGGVAMGLCGKLTSC